MEIVRELAPHWEIRATRNPCFDAVLIDQEFMEIEGSLPAGHYKVVLNTTEFLVAATPDFRRRLPPPAVPARCFWENASTRTFISDIQI